MITHIRHFIETSFVLLILYIMIIQFFLMQDDILYFFEFTIVSICDHFVELIILCACWIISIKSYMMYSKKTTIIYKTETYQTICELVKFKSDMFNNNNNSVYLTKFKIDTMGLYLVHIIYGIVQYFTDVINFFCLLIAIGQVCIFSDFRSLVPLSVFATISVIEYMYEVNNMILQQFAINSKKTTIQKFHNATFSPKQISQKDVKRGDFIELSYGDVIPADVLLLNSQKVMVNELNLTGENIVVPKTGITCDNFNNKILHINHYQNTGLLKDKNLQTEYNKNNIVFRGTEIIDGKMFGIVIECGNDCQIYRLDYNLNKNKTPIQEKLTKICTRNLYLLFIISTILGFVIIDKSGNAFRWTDLVLNICRIILLFNTMIPLSLQFFFNMASVIITKRIENTHQVKFNSNGIRSFQVNPHFIVTDKTGTLTTNKMELSEYWYNGKNIMMDDVTDNHALMQNILSCSSIDLHSDTKQVLKSDLLEEILLNFVMDKTKYKLVSNHVEELGGKFAYCDDDIHEVDRVFFKNFSYDTGVKISIIKADNQHILHIQGMPEKVCEYVDDNGANELLTTIESANISKNSYKRIIAHASKIITENEMCHFLANNEKKYLNNFTDWSIYVFNDYVVDDIYQTIVGMSNDITMLTGDKLSSAVNVGKTVGIIENDYTIFTTSDDLYKTVNGCCVISGELVESLIGTAYDYKLKILLNTNRKIVYRASPHIKQMYVTYLQKSFSKSVMMVGDGSNDVSALIQADIGVAIKGESITAQKVADVVIDKWTKIPKILDDFRTKQVIINNISQWVLMKHMLTAFTLFGMIIISFFETIKDPTNPMLMAFMNGALFLYMCKYAHYENITDVAPNMNILKWMIEGSIIGLMNGIYVFSNGQMADGIYLAVSSQMLVLIIKLHLIENKKSIIHKLSHFVCMFAIMCSLYLFGNVLLLQYIFHLLSTLFVFFLINKVI